jgi:glycine/D-amino acid oxidase-like deaminating enzyme
VTLLDRALPGAGTTATTFAWLNASAPSLHGPYHALHAAGMAAHARLAAELAPAPWYVPSGHLQWETSRAGALRLAERVRELQGWGYPARYLTRSEVARLEPDLLLGPDVEQVVFYPDEGFVFPSLYLAGVLRAAQGYGAVLRCHAEVAEILTAGGRAGGVVLCSGERLTADVVLCCAGRWTPDLLRCIDIDLPLVSWATAGSAAVGLLVRTAPVVADVRHVITAGDLAMRPDGGGRLLLHSEATDRAVSMDTPTTPAPSAARALLETARPLVRNMQQTPVESAAVGIRPIPLDGLAVAGWAGRCEGVYVVVTHGGVILAPILAELAAGEVHGAIEPSLAPFRPDRFVS